MFYNIKIFFNFPNQINKKEEAKACLLPNVLIQLDKMADKTLNRLDIKHSGQHAIKLKVIKAVYCSIMQLYLNALITC